MASILLIEPDVLLAESYQLALHAAGHTVCTRATAQSAICAADEIGPDIVILELHLVEHNGLEFLYEFRSYADWQHVPIIILSQAPASEFTESWELLGMALGVKTYLYKSKTSLRRLLQSVHEFSIVEA